MKPKIPSSNELARKVKLAWRTIWRRAPLSAVLLIYYAASRIPEDLLLLAAGVMALVENELDTGKSSIATLAEAVQRCFRRLRRRSRATRPR